VDRIACVKQVGRANHLFQCQKLEFIHHFVDKEQMNEVLNHKEFVVFGHKLFQVIIAVWEHIGYFLFPTVKDVVSLE